MSAGGLLLHVCCAPCAAYPVPALRPEVPRLVGFFFNPNIQPDEEHARRLDALERYAAALGLELRVARDRSAPGLPAAGEPAGEGRCRRCYDVRLRAAAREALRGGFAAFSTTLLYSIHQRHELVRAVGEQVAREEGVPFLYRDLRAGWAEGGRLYRASGLYRQRYCGCAASERERGQRRPLAGATAGERP